MVQLDAVAREVLRRRYLRQDAHGEVAETPAALFDRVATDLARAEVAFGGDPAEEEATADRFEAVMRERRFLPNSPTLMNAGTPLQQLAACFVLPVEDSLPSIFDALKHTALIHQSGGGTGFSFSALRPAGDVVKKTGGVASGPVSFMRIFDAATEQIKQGGRRRGANMGVLSVHHPDVEAFVTAKADEAALRNFNLSVGTTATFWQAHEAGEPSPLVNPRTGEQVGQVDPDELLETIAEQAWETGDPGLLFLDTINDANPTPELGHIEATNPCGEVPLLPHEACVLGSVDLGAHTLGGPLDADRWGDGPPRAADLDGEMDWEALRETVHTGVRMLDDAIERSEFPLPEIEDAVARTRKVGLGVMGFHDALVDLGIPYDSDAAVAFAHEVMGFIHDEAWAASRQLAAERGPFPAWDESTFEEPVRNATTTSIAPTGTISLIAGCSASVEPIYSVAYTKHVLGGLEIENDRFTALVAAEGLDPDEVLEALHGRTTIQDVDSLSADLRRLFHTAHDVPAARHVEIQAAFQRHVDNAVSKTVNLPRSATVADVRETYLAAREAGVKGITVFRSGARPEQVLGEDPLKEECIAECEYAGPAGPAE